MAILLDSKELNITSGNNIVISSIKGPGRLIGISIGKKNGNFSDPFNGVITVYYDNKTIKIPTKYGGIDDIITEVIKFNSLLQIVITPYESSTIDYCVIYSDDEPINNYNNMFTKIIEYNVSPGNIVTIPIVSNENIVLTGIDFPNKQDSVFVSINTDRYNLVNLPINAIPKINILSVPGDRISITIQNNGQSNAGGVMVIQYGTA